MKMRVLAMVAALAAIGVNCAPAQTAGGFPAKQIRRAHERGVELTSSASPDAFTTYIRAEHEKMVKLMRVAGIKPE